MTPREIAQLKQHSPALQQALKEHRDVVWSFLRDRVESRNGYFIQGHHECERCSKVVYPTVKSPYNAFHPGWCIDCVLHSFLANDKTLEELEEIEQERQYEEACKMWGPPKGFEGAWA